MVLFSEGVAAIKEEVTVNNAHRVSSLQTIDTHCHLYMSPLANAVAAVQSRAHNRNVTDIIVPAYDQASWDLMTPYEADPGLHTAYGIHPWLAHEVGNEASLEDALKALRTRLTVANPVALGEIGLDTKIETSGIPEQYPLLEAQLQLAVDLDLPVILHCRGAFAELLTAVNNQHGKIRGVLHAYSRGPELGERFLAAGLHIAFGGSITRPTAKRPRKAAKRLPLERIVLETDAPSIGLDGVAAADTEPAHVADVARAMAAIRHEPVEHIAAVTTANARKLFNLPSQEGGLES